MLLDQSHSSADVTEDTTRKLINMRFDDESTRSMTDIKKSIIEGTDYIEVYNNKGSETKKIKDPNKSYFKQI
jgi:hypothetical protein